MAKNIKIAGQDADTDRDLTEISNSSSFAQSIREIFREHRPTRIVETGTYLGKGTTRVIAECIRDLTLPSARFFSIEVNPENFRMAAVQLQLAGLLEQVELVNGLSVPRSLLPTVEQLQERLVRNLQEEDIYIDHNEQERAALYYRETDFADVEEDKLRWCLEQFNYCPDFVLLDSGGHMGTVEFEYLLSQLKGPCIIGLDDTRHIKHVASLRLIKSDPRFEILYESEEKFGFCIAKWSPGDTSVESAHPAQQTQTLQVLWVRVDSIGDNILASSSLQYLPELLGEIELTVLCQNHIREIYHRHPLVKDCIGFDQFELLNNEPLLNSFLAEWKERTFDLIINSSYSRNPLADLIIANVPARAKVAWSGDSGNQSTETAQVTQATYSKILDCPPSIQTELGRSAEFLFQLSGKRIQLKPNFLVSTEEIQFAESFLAQNGIDTGSAIVLFAGAQYEVRKYQRYGLALRSLAAASECPIIALGAEEDTADSQQQLEQSELKRVFNLCGRTTLGQAAAIMKLSRAGIGAETGLAHLAAAVELPHVVLLGGGHFGRFMPYTPLTSIACLPLDCYGCNWNCRYERAHCVHDLSAAVIQRALQDALLEPSHEVRVYYQEELAPELSSIPDLDKGSIDLSSFLQDVPHRLIGIA